MPTGRHSAGRAVDRWRPWLSKRQQHIGLEQLVQMQAATSDPSMHSESVSCQGCTAAAAAGSGTSYHDEDGESAFQFSLFNELQHAGAMGLQPRGVRPVYYYDATQARSYNS